MMPDSGSGNGSTMSLTKPFDPGPPDIESLCRLSDNLGSLFRSPEFSLFADAGISVGPTLFGVNRCVLSVRSPFFHDVFARKGRSTIDLKELVSDFEVGAEAVALVLEYIYRGRVPSLPRGVCTCADDDCSHAGCRPAVDFMVEVLYASFSFQISDLVALFQRRLLHILDRVAIDDIPIILSAAHFCRIQCGKLLIKCIEMVASSNLDFLTMDKVLPVEIIAQIEEACSAVVWRVSDGSGYLNKHTKRIHRALDSDDVELVRMLLKEGHSSLDDSCALHYAVAYCDSKITSELLELGIADVNRRNQRGYTVLHVAAVRKDPKIIVSLLTKGARAGELTLDGRKPVQIARRQTKYMDYHRDIEEGKASSKERLCIEILDQAERRDPLVGEASVSLAMAGDDLRGRLLYLENRVALARVLFPMEARVAMDIAQVDGTMEFLLGTSATHRSPVDLNATPFNLNEENLIRMNALSKTVELGKRFFPRCSEVLNKIMDDDLTDLTNLDECEDRRMRYMELQDVLTKAFSEDKEEIDRGSKEEFSLDCSFYHC